MFMTAHFMSAVIVDDPVSVQTPSVMFPGHLGKPVIS